jgi:hypothetical protein
MTINVKLELHFEPLLDENTLLSVSTYLPSKMRIKSISLCRAEVNLKLFIQ